MEYGIEFQDLEEKLNKGKIVIEGIGKDAEIVTNHLGGKQSKSPVSMHLLDPEFLLDWFCFTNNYSAFIDNISIFMSTEDKKHLLSALHSLVLDEDKEASVLLNISKVLQEGANKYKANNWRLIPQEEHLNHALIHYVAHINGDTQDNHLEHCMCRLMFAYATEPSENFSYTTYKG